MQSDSPYRSLAPLRWILRIGLAVQCAGHAYWLALGGMSPLMSLFWGQRDTGGLALSETTALGIEAGFAWFFAAAALIVLVRPWRGVLLAIAGCQLLLVTAMWRTGQGFALDLSAIPVGSWSPGVAWVASLLPFAAHLARVALPLVLLLVERSLPGGLSRMAEWTARVAIACTFAAHGLEAVQHNFEFINMLIVSSRHSMSEGMATRLLTAIGAIDLLVALLVVSRRIHSVAWYMAFWGLVTALARISLLGWSGGWFHAASRAAHFVLPLMLAFWWNLDRSARRTVE